MPHFSSLSGFVESKGEGPVFGFRQLQNAIRERSKAAAKKVQEHVFDLLPNHSHHRGVDSNTCLRRSSGYSPCHFNIVHIYAASFQLISHYHHLFLQDFADARKHGNATSCARLERI
jgi:hypothetical protein